MRFFRKHYNYSLHKRNHQKKNQDKKWVTLIESSSFVDEVRASDMFSSWYQNKWLSCNVKKRQRNVCDQLFVIQLVMFSRVNKNVIQVLTWQPKRHANITILWIYACLQAAMTLVFKCPLSPQIKCWN